MKTSENGIKFIKARELFRPTKYRDGNGFSIGYGTYIDTPAEQYLLNATITEPQADALLRKDLVRFENAINKFIKSSLSQNEFDALASLCYNIGEGAFSNLILVKLINSGATLAAIKKQWLVTYITSKGVVLNVLKERRNLEFSLYEKGSNYSFLPIALIIILIIYFIKKENEKS